MVSFSASNGYFFKNGKPHFVISGEIHYFRLNPKLWEKHLKLLKDTGANTTSTYIPWGWHEHEKNKFDFTGETHSGRNLLKYIGLCKKIGLDLIVKPGPYILAEYEWQGLPEWLINSVSKNAHALDENGNIISSFMMSYMSDEYLDNALKWYDKVMPVIAQHQLSNNGPIVMMQVCNEVGIFQWLTGKVDYNPNVMIMYKKFLQDKYKTIETLNLTYGTDYSSFEMLPAPVKAIENKQDYCSYYDFHLFYREYFATYIDLLIKKIRSFDIDLQLSHNIPGWIFGNAAELTMLMSTYKDVFRKRDDIVFGLDHIPEFVSFRNAHSDLACNKILKAMQPFGPVWAAEFQAGTREHQVKSDPADLDMFYKASLAHGLKSFNYYMFSQGINPEGKEFLGDTFYFQTPLNSKAVKSSLYDVIKRTNNFINKEKESLLLSEAKAEICVGLYLPYFYTELTTSQLIKDKKLNTEKLGLKFDPRFLREELFFNGLLRSLQTLNFNYDVQDLENTSLDRLLGYKQLWVVPTELMDEDTQKLLARYVKAGGHLIIYPEIPSLDLYLNPCTALQNELELQISETVSPNTVEVYGIKNVFSVFKKKQIFKAKEEEVIAKTKYDEVCGIRKKIGKGSVTILGFAFGYTSEEHLQLFEKIVLLDKIKRTAKISDPDIQFVYRNGKKYSYLFLLNYHNQKKTFKVNSKEVSLAPFSCKVIKTEKKN